MILVIGIDPGLATCGYAVLDIAGGTPKVVGLGTLTTKKEDGAKSVADNVRRCAELARAMENLVAGRQPDAAPRGGGLDVLFGKGSGAHVVALCAEAMSFPRSSSAAAKMAMTWGLLVANTVRRGIPLLQLGPQEVKMSVVEARDASKKHVERVLVRRYGRGIRRFLKGTRRGLHEHAFDALASATACLATEDGKALLRSAT
jgi:Holliday junction resolvasome RuvABC endonuclease subunit